MCAAEPRSRRPTREDAVDVARELLDEGERVDVLAVSRRLGVSRATMHRWFGTRERLIAALFDRLAAEFIATAETQADGTGDARAFDFVRCLAELTAGYEPLRIASTREPGIILRLMLAEDGAVHGQVVEAVRRLLAEGHPPQRLERIGPAIETFVAAAIAIQWATIAAGGDPAVERYGELGRALIAQAEA